jgi:glycine C-acetyltransferase
MSAHRRIEALTRVLTPTPSNNTTSPLLHRCIGTISPFSTTNSTTTNNNKLEFQSRLSKEIQAIKDAGTYKTERVITSRQNPTITVQTSNKPLLNFCANNYLGLAGDKRVADAAIKSLQERGYGLSSVRFICGTTDKHRELEQRIAKFHGMEDAILYGSCFDANGGVFEALLGEEDVIISDALNHASIIDGIRLCKAKRLRYDHLDMKQLEEHLKSTVASGKNASRSRMIVTDGVFSMDGDVAPLQQICDLADRYGALVFIDECHATGFFGPTGRGTDEYLGVRGRIDIINSTLGKALGGATGGYTASSSRVVEMLRQRSRPYLFSNSVTPCVVDASLAVLDMIEKDYSLVERVRKNTHMFRDALTKAGFKLSGAKDHPIVPVWLGDAKLAQDFAQDMLQQGIYVIGFSFPVVPRGQARIRTQISAAHTPEMIKQCIDAFVKVGRARGVVQ